MEIFKASRQWSSRPADQRFESVTEIMEATLGYAKSAREVEGVRWDTLRVEAQDGEVVLNLREADKVLPTRARLTNWSFAQLAQRVGAPASYMRSLPATLAAQNINFGLKGRVADGPDDVASILLHQNGDLLMRAITSDKYARIWNWEVAERVLDLEDQGWGPACPFDLPIDKVDKGQKPLYASDHDMFVFLAHNDRVIQEAGNPEGLRRGLIVSNSEVGAGALKVTKFLYRVMCSNHIIWGAQDVIDLSAIHVGKIREKFDTWKVDLAKYFDSSATEEEARIREWQTTLIAPDKDAVLDLLFGKRLDLSRRVLMAGYDSVVPDQDGDPRTVWGIAQGLTRLSQRLPFADERTRVDRAAGRVLSAFTK